MDADALAHEAMMPGMPAYRKIVDHFGKGILNAHRIDREKLAKIVFNNRQQLNRLTRIVHPPVIKKIRSFLLSGSRSGKNHCAVSIPLLYEKGMQKLFNKVIVVKASRSEVVRRVGSSRNMSRREILARIKSQMKLREKCRRADFVLENDGSLTHLRKQVRDLVKTLRANA